MNNDINPLLERSEALYFAIADSISKASVNRDPKSVLAATYAEIALEHGQSLLVLLAHENLNSAIALLRVQFDLLIKSLWVFYAAPPGQVSALARAVEEGVLKEPNSMYGIKEMIEGLQKHAPPDVGASLLQFKTAAWKPLSSHIHGGVHALHYRHRQLPPNHATDTLRNSNGLSIMAAMMIAVVASGSIPPGTIAALQLRFLDCCPALARANVPT